ncbi:MAG: TIGR03915 family putative DNA repair protein [Clostridia bacterium]|nr:TIGR03915 family putative DNA repair protein [Clostridia bacterium]
MIVYKFDSTKEGLLCCLFESFSKKELPELVTSSTFQEQFEMQVKIIETNAVNAERVSKGLIKYGSIALLNRLFYALRSSDSLSENAVFQVAYKCLKNRRDETYNLTDSDVLYFTDLCSKINTERHRYLGFTRFSEAQGGILYAHIEPDNDIVDLIAPHFVKRLALRFIIHDVVRNKVVISDGKAFEVFKPTTPLVVYLSPKEKEIEALWQKYYQSVNITERKNLKQMHNFMPRRYEKRLVETKNLSSPIFKD